MRGIEHLHHLGGNPGIFAAVSLLLIGFTASAAPTINSPAAAPSSVPLNAATPVTFTASITDPSITTSGINLTRLDTNGNSFLNVGTMYDDGTHGDAVAGDQKFSLQLTLNEPSPFPITFRVSAPVKGSLTRIFSNLIVVGVSGGKPALITLTSPPNLAFLNSSPVTVSGTVSDPTATVTVNGLAAPVSGGSFTLSVAIQEGNNTLTASAKNSQGAISTASLQVTLDTTPPRISIDAPYDSFATTDSSITVTGKANDTVVGTVNNQQVAVTVNGISATVANRGFQALNVPLSLGNNSIVVTARDRAGNGATGQITVRRDNPTQSIIKIISGNNQTGAVGTQLSSPIVAAVVDGAGNPVPNQLIVFTVTQNNGSLDAAGTVEAVNTNSSGQAQARWKLGSRSGAGNNIVEATAVGFAGSAIFTASGTPGNAGMVSLDAGNDQSGAVTQPLPHPFIVVVTDSFHNRLVNVPVTFQVKQGGGSFGGQPSATTNTDSDGRAAAIMTLGPGDGIENNVAEATFQGNSGFPAAFSASGHVPGNPAATKITGVVLDNSNNPVPGATIRAFLQNVPAQQSGGLPANVSAKSDAQGQFTIQPAPVGYVKIIADGSTVTKAGKWPNLEYDLVTVAGQNNTIGLPIYLLPLDTAHQLCVSPTQGGTLTLPAIPGFSLSVLPGAATFPGGSKSGCVTVTAVHPDKIPMVPGFGQQPRFIVTIQPAGTLFNPPASVSIPNAEGLAPREVTEMYSFDHDLNTFVSIGSATVSDDGTVLRSDPGVGVLKAGWYCGGPPTPAGSVGVCGECKTCSGSDCVADNLQNGNLCKAGSGGTCINGGCIGLDVTEVSFAQNLSIVKDYVDSGGGHLDPIKNPVWVDANIDGSPEKNDPIGYVRSNKVVISGKFKLRSNPKDAVSGITIMGIADNGLKFIATGLTVLANSSEIALPNTPSDKALPNTTNFFDPIKIKWSVGRDGASQSQFSDAGTTSHKLYVTLTSPASNANGDPLYLTVLHLATANGITDQTVTALTNSWALFGDGKKPGDVKTWEGRKITYYPAGTPFSGCSTSVSLVLTNPTGASRCGALGALFSEVLGVNGIPAQAIRVTPAVDGGMLVKNWGYTGGPTYPLDPQLYKWQFAVQASSSICDGNLRAGYPCNEMVPVPVNSLYGDMKSLVGAAGQNSQTPSEKAHLDHAIVFSSLTNLYYDPSYGLSYKDAAEFEDKALDGYFKHVPGDPSTVSRVRKSSGLNMAIFR